MLDADLILTNAREILTCAGPAPLAGPRQSAVSPIRNATLAARAGTIVFVGPAADGADVLRPTPDATIVEASAYSIVPGFVDAHTHAIFAGDRRGELRRRLAGASYAEIAAAGGGIVSTVEATRAAGENELVDQTRVRLDEMLACGTTTCELKSGYGLDVETELKMLRAAGALDASHDIDIERTFMGAHEIPRDFRGRRDAYVDLIVNEMIPAVAEARLAAWCDVFCETGVFTPDESVRILETGKRFGLKPRIHADELAASGGSRVAASVGARSADHLIFADGKSITALAEAGVTATLLPTAAFYLKLGRFAPARAFIDAGVPVAIATDVNPGGGFSPSMGFAIALACFAMNLTFEEALVAATMNGAWSLDVAGRVGSLEPGKLADAVLVRGDAVNLIRMDARPVAAVIKRGRIVRGQETLLS